MYCIYETVFTGCPKEFTSKRNLEIHVATHAIRIEVDTVLVPATDDADTTTVEMPVVAEECVTETIVAGIPADATLSVVEAPVSGDILATIIPCNINEPSAQ